MITLNKDDDSNVESCCVTSGARHPRDSQTSPLPIFPEGGGTSVHRLLYRRFVHFDIGVKEKPQNVPGSQTDFTLVLSCFQPILPA